MRVLIIVSNIFNPYLGPSTAAHNTLKGFIKIQKELEKYAIKITFLSLNDNVSTRFSENIEVISNSKVLPPVTLTGELQAIFRRPKNYFDVVHSHSIYELFPYIVSKVKTIFTLHGIFWKEIYFKRDVYSKLYLKLAEIRLRLYYRWLDRFIAISPYVIEELEKRGFDTRKAVTIENPVADEFFEVEKEEDGNIILYPAAIIPRKNQAGFLKAISMIKDEVNNYKIIFTGSGDSKYRQKLKEYAKKKNLNVIFLGRVPYIKMLHLYSKASVVALTSFQETLPMSILEASATGTPVIVSNVGGLKYIVRDFFNGFLVNPGDLGDIAEKLLLILEDAKLRRDLGRNAKTVAEGYRGEVIAKKLLDLYLDMQND